MDSLYISLDLSEFKISLLSSNKSVKNNDYMYNNGNYPKAYARFKRLFWDICYYI